MKVESLFGLDLSGKILIVGDCATNHIFKFMSHENVISRQIQGGIGAEDEIASIRGVKAVFLFVSWANAISVLQDSILIEQRIKSHLRIVDSLQKLNVPFLMIDRHGFLDRYADSTFLNGRSEVPYPVALREGWRPPSIMKQLAQRSRYRKEMNEVFTSVTHYFDLIEFVGFSTYRHESGECKNNLINIAPWHYDLDSYKYAADIFTKFLSGNSVEDDIHSWELGVLNLKTSNK